MLTIKQILTGILTNLSEETQLIVDEFLGGKDDFEELTPFNYSFIRYNEVSHYLEF